MELLLIVGFFIVLSYGIVRIIEKVKNKKIRFILMYACVIASMFMILYTAFTNSLYDNTPTAWFEEDINDGEYTIIAEELGKPFLRGSTKIRIEIVHNVDNRIVFAMLTSIDNDADILTEDNYSIEYNSEYVKIQLINYMNMTENVFRFYFEDHVD